jgi:hypothetical protein
LAVVSVLLQARCRRFAKHRVWEEAEADVEQ